MPKKLIPKTARRIFDRRACGQITQIGNHVMNTTKRKSKAISTPTALDVIPVQANDKVSLAAEDLWKLRLLPQQEPQDLPISAWQVCRCPCYFRRATFLGLLALADFGAGFVLRSAVTASSNFRGWRLNGLLRFLGPINSPCILL
jgi:hypothetical protein